MCVPHSPRRAAALFLTMFTLGWSLSGGLQAARGEEAGLSFRLSYVRGYSTWGPTNVYGSAHVWPVEGEVLLEVHDLPRLPGGASYRAWIVGTTNQVMRLGSFNTTDAGDGSIDVVFDRALPKGANAVLVTVAAPGDDETRPGARRTLAGFFPGQPGTPAAQLAVSSAAPPRHGSPGLLAPPARRAPARGAPTRPRTAAGAAPPRRAGEPGAARTTGPAKTGATRTRGAARTGASHSAGTTTRRAYPRIVALPRTGGGPPSLRAHHARKQARPHQPRRTG